MGACLYHQTRPKGSNETLPPGAYRARGGVVTIETPPRNPLPHTPFGIECEYHHTPSYRYLTRQFVGSAPPTREILPSFKPPLNTCSTNGIATYAQGSAVKRRGALHTICHPSAPCKERGVENRDTLPSCQRRCFQATPFSSSLDSQARHRRVSLLCPPIDEEQNKPSPYLFMVQYSFSLISF